jgi:hypothetical protein
MAARGSRPNKTALAGLVQTLASFFLSSAPSHVPQRATPSGRRAAAERACPRRCLEPLAGVRVHVGWTCHHRVASAALLRVHSPRRGGEHRLRRDLVADADPEEVRQRDLGPDHTPTRCGRVLPAQPADPQHVDLRPTVTVRDPSKFYSSLCSSSSPTTDKRPNPALVPKCRVVLLLGARSGG